MPQVRQPKAAQKQAAEAERLMKQISGQGNPEELEPAPDAAKTELNKEAESTTIVEPAEPEEEQGKKGLEAEPSSSTKGEEPKGKQQDDWEKRFKGMKSLYDREVPKLRSELETAYSTIDEMKQEIADIHQKLETKPEPQPELEPVEFDLTDEEKEQYGEGLIGVMQRIAGQSRNALAKQVVDLQTKLANLESGQKEVTKTIVNDRESSFFAALDKAVPDWRDINTDSEFHAFLAEEVPYTGNERQFYLKQARDKLDSGKVISIFQDYLASTGAASEGSSPKLGKASLEVPEDQIVPSTQKGEQVPTEEDKVWTTEEIDEFYRDKRLGKYKGKEAEAREIEKDILLAAKTKRIVTKRRRA